MDISRFQALAVCPSSDASGCLHMQRMQLFGGNALQKLTPGRALEFGRHRRVKCIGVRASISPDVAGVAIAAAAVLPVCWLYINKFISSSATSSSEVLDRTDSAEFAATVANLSTLVEPEIASNLTQTNGSAKAANNIHVPKVADELRHISSISEVESVEDEYPSKSIELRSKSGIAECTIKSTLEGTDGAVRGRSWDQTNDVIPSISADISTMDDESANCDGSLEVKDHGTIVELEGEAIDGLAGDLTEDNIVIEPNNSTADLQDNPFLEKKFDSVLASCPEVGPSSIAERISTDVKDNLVVEVSEPVQYKPLNPKQVVLRRNGAPFTRTDGKSSTVVQRGVEKTICRQVPMRLSELSEILAIDETADANLHLKVYRAFLSTGRLQDCVSLLEAMDKVKILDTGKIHQSKFFKTCQVQKAVKEAFRFTRLIRTPTINTYNMLIAVCREARDVNGGIRALSLAEKSGFKPDAILYTTLISTCAKAGKVNTAFKVLHDMEAAGVVANIQTYGSLIDGCARAGQIAKAFGVYGIMLSKQVKPDIAIFNTLINACGRAGALERAFDVLADMKGEPCFLEPNHITYGALISACARAGQVERAFDVYRSMRLGRAKGTPECYTAVVHACSQNGDLKLATTVLEDMRTDGVQPDEIFFSALVDVAGHANDVEGAFQILVKMKEFGLMPRAITYSAVMGMCSNTGNWERAFEVYQEIRASGLLLTVSTYNALITALSDAKQIHQAFAVLEEMKRAGVMPDQITYSILLETCQTMNEPERAFDLYSKARAEGVLPNQAMCDSLIGICYASIKNSRRSTPVFSVSRGVLSGPDVDAHSNQWTNWALSVYRQTVASGSIPTIKSFSFLLGCLRTQNRQDRKLIADELVSTFEISKDAAFLGAGCPYDPRAFDLFDEAASMDIVPRVNYIAGPITLNAEELPSYVAEVCLLTLLKGLKNRHDAGKQLFPVTIKHAVEIKQTLTATREVKELSISGRSGQAMSALLRRLKLHYQGHESSGKLHVTVASIRKWLTPPTSQLQALIKTEPNQGLGTMRPRNVFVARCIAEQQRAIRSGRGPNSPFKMDLTGSERSALALYRKQMSQVTSWDIRDENFDAEQDHFTANAAAVNGVKRVQSVVVNAQRVNNIASSSRLKISNDIWCL